MLAPWRSPPAAIGQLADAEDPRLEAVVNRALDKSLRLPGLGSEMADLRVVGNFSRWPGTCLANRRWLTLAALLGAGGPGLVGPNGPTEVDDPGHR